MLRESCFYLLLQIDFFEDLLNGRFIREFLAPAISATERFQVGFVFWFCLYNRNKCLFALLIYVAVFFHFIRTKFRVIPRCSVEVSDQFLKFTFLEFFLGC